MSALTRLRARYSRAARAHRKAHARFWEHLPARTEHPRLAADPQFVTLDWSEHVLDLRTDRRRPLVTAFPTGHEGHGREATLFGWTTTYWSTNDVPGQPYRNDHSTTPRDLYVALTAPDGARSGVIVTGDRYDRDPHTLYDLLHLFPSTWAHISVDLFRRMPAVHAALTSPDGWTGPNLTDQERAEALRALPGLASPHRPTWAHARAWHRVGVNTDKQVHDWYDYFTFTRRAFQWAMEFTSPLTACVYGHHFTHPGAAGLWHRHAPRLAREHAATLHERGWQPPTYRRVWHVVALLLDVERGDAPRPPDADAWRLVDERILAMATITGMSPQATLTAFEAGLGVDEVRDAMARPEGVNWDSVRAMSALRQSVGL